MNISAANICSVEDMSAICTFITACYSINIILSLPTNFYILWLMLTGTREKMTAEFFALNLSVSEMFFCVSSVTWFIVIHIPKVAVYSFFYTGFVKTGRTLFQSCVCVERYLAVVHPVTFLKYKPLRYKIGCCAVVWLMVISSCLFCMKMSNTSIYYYCFFVQNFILFFLMVFCCLSVLWALKRPGPGDREREGTNDMKIRAFKIIFIIQVVMIVNYLPEIVLFCFHHVFSTLIFYMAITICLCIDVICGFVQPLLYLHRTGKLPCLKGL